MTSWTLVSPGTASGLAVNRLKPRMAPTTDDDAPTTRQPATTPPSRPSWTVSPWWWATAIDAPAMISPIRQTAVAIQALYPMIACNLSTPGMATGVELNPAPGAGVGEGDGVGAARTTSAAARLMCAVLSGAPARRS